MADYTQLLYDIEVHSPEGIRRYFEQGGNPNDVIDGTPVFTTMVEMYLRSARFKDCVNEFISAGLNFEDEALLSVLIDDDKRLERLIDKDPGVINKTYALHKNAFTPLTGGTLLHYCAEFNSIACAKILVARGADIDAKAALDEHGFGGHTPIFHTVNQLLNNSIDMLYFLPAQGADLTYTVKGLVWGTGYEWETFIPAVSPISYAMMGLLPMMHRKQETVAKVVSLLVKHAYGIEYLPPNVPNAYLKK
ncbi:MAG TPA: ankyrin repeat domain-containing protein [Mucilaginibacter sp.]|jgi:hypothetical protein|nr:ankyrin repeat domain-containing protein [Mucilaginibacter sp.]